MSTVQGRLRIAVQKSGRLADRSLDLVRDAGLRVVKGNNDLLYRIENYPIDLLRVRDDDIPTFVADGVCDLGIVGENVLEEVRNGGPNAEVVMPLGFGRCTLKIAVPPTLDYAGPRSLDGLRIATSYPKILRRFLDDHDVQRRHRHHARRGRGGPPAEAGLGHLRPGLDRGHAGGQRPDAQGDGAGQPGRADPVADRARGRAAAPAGQHHRADGRRGVLAGGQVRHAERARVRPWPRSPPSCPGAGSPTVMPLSGRDDAVAVHAVCQEAVFWETLEKLKAAGASAILVLPIEKMM